MEDGRYTLEPQTKILLADLCISHGNVLRRAALPGDLLDRAGATLPSADYHRLWEALEAESGDSALPLRITAAQTAEAFSPLVFAALCSADLNRAALRLQTYKRLIGPMRLDVDIGEETTTIACRWVDEQPPIALALTSLLFWIALVRIGCREEVRPLAVVTTEPPVEQASYIEAIGVPIGSAHEHAITFTAADAARPFLTASEAMWAGFEPSLRTRLADLDAVASTEDRVRAALVELLPAGEATMRSVGRSLAMSTRTLQRRLSEEGTSYQAVLADTREALARHYLADETISTADISFLLGYADPSSFYRALHGWTGLTPERLRNSIA